MIGECAGLHDRYRASLSSKQPSVRTENPQLCAAKSKKSLNQIVTARRPTKNVVHQVVMCGKIDPILSNEAIS